MTLAPDVTEPDPTPTRTRPPAAKTSPFGALLLRLHFYAGILVAPFLLVAALTGLAYTFTPQLEKLVYADELTAAKPGGQVLPLAQQVAAARAAYPAGTLTTVRPGEGDATTQVDFTSPDLDEEHQHTVYVNPYTGAVTGQMTTWWATTPLKTWFDDLHRNLHLGATGRHYSEFAASWLWVITLGGVVLWWRRHKGARTARRLLAPDLAAKKGVRRTRSWHAATGLWLTVGLLLLSATGMTWSRYAGANFAAALDSLRSGTPSVSTALTSAPAAAAGGHHGGGATTAPVASVDPAVIDTVLATARKDGLSGPVAIGVPADAATAWTVTQTRDLWPVGRDSVAVDAATSKVVDRVNFADWPLLAKLTRWGINAHMGTLFGLVNQLLLAALAIGLVCVIVWGYRMWWQRRPTRADRRAVVGTPPVRGAWVGLPAWVIVVGVPAVVALGWALPLFGIPLAAFLLIDVIVGGMRRRNAAAPTSPAPAGS
ncbi:PepSY-associated TM helix domain-containing protein [Krasilnikovia sp. MM14-A1004]|uniref:PepSY-associated TM helix domain-containing protein n=1 Tax=Krasilnikovia sp. MM14-A1004 TaxID=3373541 RepID=UPI00399C5F87